MLSCGRNKKLAYVFKFLKEVSYSNSTVEINWFKHNLQTYLIIYKHILNRFKHIVSSLSYKVYTENIDINLKNVEIVKKKQTNNR